MRAIIQVESAFDDLAVSTAGARGLMQLMPATAFRFGVTDSFDARQNIFAGTRYLRILLDTYGGDVSLCRGLQRRRGRGGPLQRDVALPGDPELVRKVNALLGGAPDTFASAAPAMLIAGRADGSQGPFSQAAAPGVKRPSVYYRWKDANGVVHMEQAPPTTAEWTTIRSRD